MRYIHGFREGTTATALARLLAAEVDAGREYHLMEFCGGHTHAIARYGVEELLPDNVRLVHGPGCPVCVLPVPRLDAAIELACRPGVTLLSYGDMLRVPASRKRSLLRARAGGADVRIVASALEALEVARAEPARQVVLFAIGFETTTPASACLIREAAQRGLENLSVYCNHVLTPAAIQSILDAPEVREWGSVRVDGFIGPSHVSAVIGSRPYENFAEEYQRPVVIAGFEPLDVLQAIRMLVAQLNDGRACVENEFTRGVTREGNVKAQRLVAEVFELRPSFEWRGFGALPYSGLRIKAAFAAFDAERRFAMPEHAVPENAACQCPAIIRGVKKPTDCRIFGTVCTPRAPVGSCMVSAEGACAAHYKYRRVHAFNSLAQRLYVELGRDGHALSVELDIHERITLEAVALFRPDVVLAPFLKRAIPVAVWRHHLCLVVHPGPPGDRGPAALDWAILKGVPDWGVTVLQAVAELDAGPVWAAASFPMRLARKSSLYHHEVTEAAVRTVRAALGRVLAGRGPLGVARAQRGDGWQPPPPPQLRQIDWCVDDRATVVRKVHSADGFPGVEDTWDGRRFRVFDARPEAELQGPPGALIARRHGAVCRATRDGGVWIGQLQPVTDAGRSFKRPALLALGTRALALPERAPAPGEPADARHDGEIDYREVGAVGHLRFEFYNGALGSDQCARLRAAYAAARRRPTRVIVLSGGPDFWCNGMHLHCIEAAESAADASWANINLIDDLARDILTTDTQLTVAALGGNAAAGGVFLALATDRVVARSGIVLNPHYRNMGNLYGSEYWTYRLPGRVGARAAEAIMADRLPLGAPEALALGLIDAHAGPGRAAFDARVAALAASLAASPDFEATLAAKCARRAADERQRPLADYRRAELDEMHRNFYGFDPSYHIARHRFVHRRPHAWTPLHLARHRRLDYREAVVPAGRA
jgi:putative two-component system hydrogenase maturation factor HypX/HoxX